MTVRLLLVSHLMTPATRRAAFPDDEPVEPGPGLLMRPREGTRVVRGPERRCAETCERIGLDAEVDEALRDWDLGRWRGRTLEDLSEAEPAAVSQWLHDPGSAPHGGESLVALLARVAGWLDGLAGGSTVAIGHPGTARAAVLHALGSGAGGFWRLDVAPGTVTSLSGRAGRWNLSRLGTPLLIN